MSEVSDKDAPRITDQFRGRRGMVYELRCSGARLTVGVSPRENPDDLDDWRVDVSWGPRADAVVVTEWGPTKATAVSMAGASWARHAVANGLPAVDWNAVSTALAAVRAL